MYHYKDVKWFHKSVKAHGYFLPKEDDTTLEDKMAKIRKVCPIEVVFFEVLARIKAVCQENKLLFVYV